MTYATQAQMVTRFGEQELLQLTDLSNLGQIDVAVVSVALTDADAEINSYLAGRYNLPLTQVSAELVRLACDIARYRLFDVRASEAVKVRYDDAIKKLRDIGKGVASLGIDAVNQPIAAAGDVQMMSGGRDFARPGRGNY
jgi:phage gp36-like protein